MTDLIQQLLAATQEQADAEPGGRENFAEYCDNAREYLNTHRIPGWLALCTELRIKATQAREGRVYNSTKPARAAVKREESPATPRATPAETTSRLQGVDNPMGALPIPGHLPDDPDDQPW